MQEDTLILELDQFDIRSVYLHKLDEPHIPGRCIQLDNPWFNCKMDFYINTELQEVYYPLDDSQKKYWRFSSKPACENNTWLFSQPMTREDIVSFVYRMRAYEPKSANALKVLPLEKDKFLQCNTDIANLYPFLFGAGDTVQAILSNEDYNCFSSQVLTQDKWAKFNMVIERPERLFYCQYSAFNQLPFPVYKEMVEIDGQYRRRSIYLHEENGTLTASVSQFDDGIKAVSWVDGTNIRRSLHSNPQNFFSCDEYVVKLRHSYIKITFNCPTMLMNVVSFGTIDHCHVISYEAILKQLQSSYSRVYISDYIISNQYLKGSHALILDSNPHKDDISYRETELPIMVDSPKDLQQLAREAWSEPKEEGKLKPSKAPQARSSIIYTALIVLMIVLGLGFEILAAIYQWKVSIGVFHNVPVWFLMLYSLIIVGVVGCFTGYAIYVLKMNQDYSVKPIPLDALRIRIDQELPEVREDAYDIQMFDFDILPELRHI